MVFCPVKVQSQAQRQRQQQPSMQNQGLHHPSAFISPVSLPSTRWQLLPTICPHTEYNTIMQKSAAEKLTTRARAHCKVKAEG